MISTKLETLEGFQKRNKTRNRVDISDEEVATGSVVQMRGRDHEQTDFEAQIGPADEFEVMDDFDKIIEPMKPKKKEELLFPKTRK